MDISDKIILGLLVLVVAGGGVAAYWVRPKVTDHPALVTPNPTQYVVKEKQLSSKENSSPTTTIKEGDFNQTGYITGGYLVYEMAGKPGLRAKLKFERNSICDGHQCTSDDWKDGKRVTVVGKMSTNQVIVLEMKTIN